MLKRGERSYGRGGQSSLGYLFGSDDENSQKKEPPAKSSPIVYMPPYGTDYEDKPPPQTTPPQEKSKASNSYSNIVHGQKSKNFTIADRPSTKVKSVPGGDSSLGYLFGDKC